MASTHFNDKNIYRAGVILHNSYGAYLFVKGRKHHKWSFPKGELEEGESWKTCAQRETREETGFRVNIPQKDAKFWLGLNCVYYFIEYSRDVSRKKGRFWPRDTEEVEEVAWITPRSLRNLRREEVNTDVWNFIQSRLVDI